MLQGVALCTAGAYGLVALAGGLVGYKRAGSRASLIAGSVSGALLLGAAVVGTSNPAVGLGVAAVVSLGLVARFARSARSADARRSPVARMMIAGGVAVLGTVALAWAAS